MGRQMSPRHQKACLAELVSSESFGIAIGCVIIANLILIAVETDYETWHGWPTVNHAFLVVFCVEISLKLLAYGWYFFSPSNHDLWYNIIDLLVVVISLVDAWVWPLVQASADKNMYRYVLTLRTLRAFRTIRVVEVFGVCPPLRKLARGMYDSTQLVAWIGLFLFMQALIFSILITTVVGQHAGEFEHNDEVIANWGGVIISLQTLFQFLTFDGWSPLARLITDRLPWMTILFDTYIALGAFAMLSILTGVVSDHMGQISQLEKKDDQQLEAAAANEIICSLHDKLFMIDGTPKGTICKTHFENVLCCQEMKTDLNKAGLKSEGELLELWDCFNTDDDNMLSWEELKSGLLRLRNAPDPKDMLRMRFAAERVARWLSPEQDDEFNSGTLDEVSECMNDIEHRLTKLDGHLHGFIRFMTCED